MIPPELPDDLSNPSTTVAVTPQSRIGALQTACFLLTCILPAHSQSPFDGDDLFFYETRSNPKEMRIFDLDTGEDKLWKSGAEGARLSPDGNTVAYSDIFSDAFVVPPDGEEPQLVRDSVQHLAWLPDGSGLTFASWANLFVREDPADPGTESTLLDNMAYDSQAGVMGVSWSPDGKKVAYLGQPDISGLTSIRMSSSSKSNVLSISVPSPTCC